MDRKLIRVKRKFSFCNIPFRIALMAESHTNGAETVEVLRVLAPNGNILPISIQHKETLKSIETRSIGLLNMVLKDNNIPYLESECL